MKTRTKEAIDLEYTNHAAHVGHKTNIIAEQELNIEALRCDIESHLGQMRKLRKEVAAPPAAETAVAVEPPAETADAVSPPVDQL